MGLPKTIEEDDVSTDLVARSGLDLTRAPAEQWNREMLDMVAKSVFRGQQMTQAQLYYCLSVAEGIGLNPMIGEVYFIPSKSRDGKGPAMIPYVGRNGLVKKASERAYYYESDTVHANDRFRVNRRKDGTVEVTHSYSPTVDRGEIVGAYAFLHDESGRRRPAFFYAEWEQYRPEFDLDWKWKASPWGNQSSAMIEKCAMIGAGRKRLDLGNVLADGEIARVQQMQEVGPRSEPPASVGVFDFASVTDDAELAERLRVATAAEGWPAAKCEMVLRGLSDEQLAGVAEGLEASAQPASEAIPDAEVVEDAERGESGTGAQDASRGEALAMLRRRAEELEDALNDPTVGEGDARLVQEELERVEREMRAIEDSTQADLFGGAS